MEDELGSGFPTGATSSGASYTDPAASWVEAEERVESDLEKMMGSAGRLADLASTISDPPAMRFEP